MREQMLKTGASGMLLVGLRECLSEVTAELAQVTHFVADTGPGSFIGARVAVTLAKTLAYAQGTKCAGVNAFDLIAPDKTVVIPNRRGEWFLRVPGQSVERVNAIPGDAAGYGADITEQAFPHASRSAGLSLQSVDPELLMPTYLVEPNISTPKSPYAEAPK